MFNGDVLYGDETDASEILTYAREISFFSSRRLIIVKWAEKLSSREGEALIPYFQDPSDTTILVMVGAKFDGRLKWVQALKKHAAQVDCSPMFENQRVGWIKQQANHLGVQLDESALHQLKDMASEGLYLTKSELDKLGLYLPAGHPATAEDVEILRGREPGASVFELAGAIGMGDPGQALRIVAKNLETGEAPLRILGALIWQVRRIWKAKDLLGSGNNEAQVARAIGIPPFRASEFFRHVRGWSVQQLSTTFDLVWETDSKLKGGAATSPSLVLDTLILRLCAISKQTRQEMGGAGGKPLSSKTKRDFPANSR